MSATEQHKRSKAMRPAQEFDHVLILMKGPEVHAVYGPSSDIMLRTLVMTLQDEIIDNDLTVLRGTLTRPFAPEHLSA